MLWPESRGNIDSMLSLGATRHICKSIITAMLVSSNYTSKCKELRQFLFMNLLFIFFSLLLPWITTWRNLLCDFITIISKIKGCVFRCGSLNFFSYLYEVLGSNQKGNKNRYPMGKDSKGKNMDLQWVIKILEQIWYGIE